MSNSITRLILGLKQQDSDATQMLWSRFSERLVNLARLRLASAPKQLLDEDDIASTVFYSLCRGAAEGRLEDVKSRDELWWVLLALTKQKVTDFIRHEMAQKRGNGKVKAEASLMSKDNKGFTLDDLIAEQPTAELMLVLEEENIRLLGLLRDDTLRQIAQLRIEGYTPSEIASNVGVSQRSVERKLQLIRKTWAREFDHGAQS